MKPSSFVVAFEFLDSPAVGCLLSCGHLFFLESLATHSYTLPPLDGGGLALSNSAHGGPRKAGI